MIQKHTKGLKEIHRAHIVRPQLKSILPSLESGPVTSTQRHVDFSAGTALVSQTDSSSSAELESFSKQLETAFDMGGAENVALSLGDSCETKVSGEQGVTMNDPTACEKPQSPAKEESSFEIESLSIQGKDAKPKGPASVKPAMSHLSHKVIKYIRSPGDYAFFDLDRYEQSISDEGKKEFRVRPLSDEDVARHPEAADGDVKSEKSAKSKKKHVHKWLRKQHKKRGSYEVDLLTKFGDTSRLNSDKSSSEAAFDEENDKFSKSDDSCSLSRSSFSFKDQHSLIEEEGNVLPKTIEDIRKETGTQVLLLSSKYVTGPRRVGDERLWNSRNLRCAHCLGKCPVCSIACCVYEEARRKMAKSSSDCDKAAAAELVQIIEGFGSKVKDMSTFSLCSILGGCGRRVCPDCSGICPTNICRDVQCKDCKPDPWEPCNWHDF